MAIFEIAKKWNLVKNIFVKLIYLISRVILAWTFLNFLAPCEKIGKLILYCWIYFILTGLPDNLRVSATEKESNWSHWSIRTLFGIGITSACSVADSSKIFIDVTQDTFELLPENQESQEIVLKTEERTLKEFDVQNLVNAGINNLSAKYKNKPFMV